MTDRMSYVLYVLSFEHKFPRSHDLLCCSGEAFAVCINRELEYHHCHQIANVMRALKA